MLSGLNIRDTLRDAVREVVNFGQLEPTPENIELFKRKAQALCAAEKNEVEMHYGITFLKEDIFDGENISPIWKFLAASVIYKLYTNNIKDLTTNSPNWQQSLLWADKVIDFPATEYQGDLQLRFELGQVLIKFYTTAGQFEANIQRVKCDSRNYSIQAAFRYYRKFIELISASEKTKFQDVANILNAAANYYRDHLPENIALNDPLALQVTGMIERAIDFHLNVPDNKKTLFVPVAPQSFLNMNSLNPSANEETPAQPVWLDEERKLAATNCFPLVVMLAEIYSAHPKVRGQSPDFQKAVITLLKTTNLDADEKLKEIISQMLERPQLKRAHDTLSANMLRKAQSVMEQLTALTDNYLAKENISAAKRAIFVSLKEILADRSATTIYARINAYEAKLRQIDTDMLFAHRTASWKRYVANAVSFLLLIPAIVRCAKSYKDFGTLRFWKSEANKSFELAHEQIMQYENVRMGR